MTGRPAAAAAAAAGLAACFLVCSETSFAFSSIGVLKSSAHLDTNSSEHTIGSQSTRAALFFFRLGSVLSSVEASASVHGEGSRSITSTSSHVARASSTEPATVSTMLGATWQVSRATPSGKALFRWPFGFLIPSRGTASYSMYWFEA